MEKYCYSGTKTKEISDKLYGIFFEDINFALDGGINNNQVVNCNFDFQRVGEEKDAYHYLARLFGGKCKKKRSYCEIDEPLKYWSGSGKGNVVAEKTAKAHKYNAVVEAKGEYTLCNIGYNGGDSEEKSGRGFRRNSGKCGFGIKAGNEYDVKIKVDAYDFCGTLKAYIKGEGALTDVVEFKPIPGEPQTLEGKVRGIESGLGKLVLELDGNGRIALLRTYFGDADYYGVGDPKWTGGRLRKDITLAIKALSPRFVRFPGGCLVEGYNLSNAYDWKETVGELDERKPKPDLWAERQKGKDYMQSYEIGFYEYFLLCEELGAEPMPIVNAGIACQYRCFLKVRAGEPAFQKYIDDAIDLVEFANGDPKTNKWAAIRAEMGHPEPFNMKLLGIGNENWGEDYFKNFKAIKSAVNEKYPYIQTIRSTSGGYKIRDYEEQCKPFEEAHLDGFVDDHFYRTPQWALENAHLYDDYARERAPIFVGECAANCPWDNKAQQNNFFSALGEAAFWTGLERNADIVRMSSYAPLCSKIGGENWRHNLINFNSLAVLPTVNYMVQKLFSNNFGSTSYLGRADAENMFTSVTGDGKYIYIKAVNAAKTPTEVEFSFDFPLGSYTMQTLSSVDDYARNTLDYSGLEPKINIPLTTEVGSATEGAFAVAFKPRSVNIIKIEV